MYFMSMGFTLLNSLCPLEKYSLISYLSFYRLAITAFLLNMVPVTVDCGNELACFWRLRSTCSCQGLSSPAAPSQLELCQLFQVSCFPWEWLLPTCTVALSTNMIILTSHMSSTGLLKCRVGFTRLLGGIWCTDSSSKIVSKNGPETQVIGAWCHLRCPCCLMWPSFEHGSPWPVLYLPALGRCLTLHGIWKVTKRLCLHNWIML